MIRGIYDFFNEEESQDGQYPVEDKSGWKFGMFATLFAPDMFIQTVNLSRAGPGEAMF